ncbi:hypothetical protein SGLAM104S_02737 [Streptomyces glaucescens]
MSTPRVRSTSGLIRETAHVAHLPQVGIDLGLLGGGVLRMFRRKNRICERG